MEQNFKLSLQILYYYDKGRDDLSHLNKTRTYFMCSFDLKTI